MMNHNDREKFSEMVEKLIRITGCKPQAAAMASEEELKDAEFLLCMRSDMEGAWRLPGSIDVECEGCRAMVVLSPGIPVKAKKLCIECALRYVSDATETTTAE